MKRTIKLDSSILEARQFNYVRAIMVYESDTYDLGTYYIEYVKGCYINMCTLLYSDSFIYYNIHIIFLCIFYKYKYLFYSFLNISRYILKCSHVIYSYKQYYINNGYLYYYVFYPTSEFQY